MKELSILIPARSEMFLKNTVEDILKNREADTEIIITLDGAWSDPPIMQDERVNIIYVGEAVGQRAATNLAAKLAQGKYVMKVDAHCSFDKGFDRKMIEFFEKVGDNVTAVPIMRNLWAFDWKCLAKGTMIVTPNGLKPIEEIKKGEKIISGDAKLHTVTRTMSREIKTNIVCINPNLLLPIRTTKDHLVKVYEYKYKKITKPNSHKTIISNKAKWVEAGKLKEGMYKMIFPFSSYESLGTLKNIKNKEQIAKLLGYFIAEGNFYHKNSQGQYMKMTMCLNWKEDYIADEIKKIIENNFNNRYGKKAVVNRFKKTDKRNGNKYMRVNIYSQEATRFVKQFILGENARNKYFISEVLRWPKKIQRILLDAMIDGDGWIGLNRKNLVTTYTTSSKQLAYQVFVLMLRLGYRPGIETKINKGSFGKGNLCYSIKAYSSDNNKNCKGIVRNNEYIVSIHSIKEEAYNGRVYDLTINGLSEILTEGGVVHNCHRCGWKIYQDKSPTRCGNCNDSRYLRRKMLWIGKHNPQSTSYCFDSEPKFRYFEDYKHRPQYIKDKAEKGYTETMSLQGSCFMATRKMYWEKELCDETLGSWGNQGIEVACKTWLSGGQVLVNHNTWYAHLFRTKTNFGFPWPVSGRQQLKTKKNVRDLLWNNKWNKQIKPVKWLVEKFWPVPGWTQEDLDKLGSSL